MLVSNNPKIKTLADFTNKDRIAVGAVTVSVGARYLQYAAAQTWGDKEYDRLDKYTVAMPHPDATAALIGGGTEITAHFSMPPFQEQAIASPNVHMVLDTYDLFGPNSPVLLFATEKFRTENPRTYKAFIEALAEAAKFVQRDKGTSADIYIRTTGAKIKRDDLLKLLSNPKYEFTINPKGTYKMADFMYRIGAIKNRPESWRDYFFIDSGSLEGS